MTNMNHRDTEDTEVEHPLYDLCVSVVTGFACVQNPRRIR